jgi:VWFA-related protein
MPGFQHRNCFAFSLLLLFFLHPCLYPQNNSFKVRVDVDLTTAVVTALDKKGNPVRNLKKEDFQLYEDGKIQEILNIDEVNAEAETSSLGAYLFEESASRRGKTVLIIFSTNSAEPDYIKNSRESAQRFVQEHMRPQDLFAVAAYGASMKILQNFTSDREEVLEAIKNAAVMNLEAGQFDSNDLLRSLEGIDYSVAPIKGQKSILIYLPPVPPAVDPMSRTRAPRFAFPAPSGPSTYVAADSSDLNKVIDSARKSNSTFYVIEPEASTSTATSSLTNLAIDTGGSVINKDTDAELGKLDRRISNYYVLGFQSSNPRRNGAFRKLEVKTELKEVNLKHQAGYQDQRPIDVQASAKQERTLLTALASPGAAAQLPIVFRPLYFYDSPRTARVLVVSRIRMEKAAFKKKGGQLGTDLNIMGVAYAEDGSIAARFSETLPLAFDKEKEPEFRKKVLAYRNYFKLRPGKYRLKLAVSDESDNLGSMEQPLQVPALPDRGFAGSSIVIAEQALRMPDLIRNLQTQLLDEDDPLLYRGIQIEPRVENRLHAGAGIPLAFRVYNLPGPHDRWNLTAKVRLLDENGQEYDLRPIPLKAAASPAGKAEALVAFNISLSPVPPGKYRLIIEAGEPGSQDIATLQTDLEFVK